MDIPSSFPDGACNRASLTPTFSQTHATAPGTSSPTEAFALNLSGVGRASDETSIRNGAPTDATLQHFAEAPPPRASVIAYAGTPCPAPSTGGTQTTAVTDFQRSPSESGVEHAARLLVLYPDLTLRRLVQLSGAPLSEKAPEVDRTTQISKITEIAKDVPPLPDESFIMHALRIDAKYPGLTFRELALLTGGAAGDLRSDPRFYEVPPDLQKIRDSIPSQENEARTHYAQRVYKLRPDLTATAISLISDVHRRNVLRTVVRRKSEAMPLTHNGRALIRRTLPANAEAAPSPSRKRAARRTDLSSASDRPTEIPRLAD